MVSPFVRLLPSLPFLPSPPFSPLPQVWPHPPVPYVICSVVKALGTDTSTGQRQDCHLRMPRPHHSPSAHQSQVEISLCLFRSVHQLASCSLRALVWIGTCEYNHHDNTNTCSHMYTHTYTHAHTRIHACTHTHTCMHTHTHTHTRTHKPHANTYTCIHTYMHTHTHTNTHMHIYTGPSNHI